jgi:hypothetical protein
MRINRNQRTTTGSLWDLASGTRFVPRCFLVSTPGHHHREFLRFVGRHDQSNFEQSAGDGKRSLRCCSLQLGVETPAIVASSWFGQLWKSEVPPSNRGGMFCDVIDIRQEYPSRPEIRGGPGATLRGPAIVPMKAGRSIPNMMENGHVRSACNLKPKSVVD